MISLVFFVRPWLGGRLGFEPTTSRLVDRCLSYWANRAEVFFFISLDWPKRLKLWLSVAASSWVLIRLEGAVLSFQRQNSKKTKNHNTMYSLIYSAKVLTRNIIGGFPTKAIAVLSFRLFPPLKNKTKTNDKCTSLWKTFNNKRKKWSLDYTEKSVSRVEGSLAYSSYPG